jgi:hypothetical protein
MDWSPSIPGYLEPMLQAREENILGLMGHGRRRDEDTGFNTRWRSGPARSCLIVRSDLALRFRDKDEQRQTSDAEAGDWESFHGVLDSFCPNARVRLSRFAPHAHATVAHFPGTRPLQTLRHKNCVSTARK